MPFSLRRNIRLKSFSFLIALVWWAVVHGEDARIKDFVVPIDYINLAQSLEQSGRIVDTVTVRLRAPEAVLRNVTEDRLAVALDLGRAPLGEQHIPITGKMMRVPPGTEVVRVSPAVIPVRVERRARREVPIVAEFSGAPPKGFARLGYAVTPPVATIEGPASEVAAVARALTGTILLEGETADMEFEVRPIPEAPSGSRVRILVPADPVLVQVRIGHADAAAPAGVGRPAAPPGSVPSAVKKD
ncbi:MAG TPA: CdaR family protein [Candidatus Polarisedimenticolia bacterium]|jgi:YbbR domain-containing protein|nr:CdaR family protein [Candidatus Polarisedimenticolia bacterium]